MRPCEVRTGGCAWRLPPDESCAPVARSLTTETLTALGLPRGLVYDVATGVSELATNALQHGLGFGRNGAGGPDGHRRAVMCPPELWIHRRSHPEGQLVLRVFDPDRSWHRAARPGGVRTAVDAEHGRGLGIVDVLFGEWFTQLTRSRFGPVPTPGKAVGFRVSVAGLYDVPPDPRVTPVDAARELHGALAARGVDGVHTSSGGGMAVVFVRPGLTVYCHPAAFRWKDRTGADVRRPLADALDVTEAVLARHEEFDVLPAGVG
jgi:hypothetical protein